MSTCLICYEGFKKPLCLPCGHLFCTECLVKTVQAIKPSRNFHSCPICRGTYSIVPVNPAAIPMHLRPFVTPSVRRVYLDSSSPDASSSSSSSPTASELSDELAKLRTENQTLRNHCVLWRRRAEVHGAATLGLLDFARMVRDQAVSLAQERDALKNQCRSLKRRLDETLDQSGSQLSSYPVRAGSPNYHPFTFSCPLAARNANNNPAIAQATFENPRFAAALLELQSCMDQASSSSSTMPAPMTMMPPPPVPQSSQQIRLQGGGHPRSRSAANAACPGFGGNGGSRNMATAATPIASTSSIQNSRLGPPPTKRSRPSSSTASAQGFPSVQIPSMGIPATSFA